VQRRLDGTKGHSKSRGLYFFLWKRKRKSSIGIGFFVRHRRVSAVQRVESVSDRMSYIVLRGHWCNIIVLNVHALSEEKSDDSDGIFYEELEQVFHHFHKYYMNILLEDINAEVERENIF
jgi:hypothetical protein